MAKCQHLKQNNVPCKANALQGSSFCFFHEASKKVERTAARRAGGRSNRPMTLPDDSPDLRLRNATDVVVLLETTVNQVRRGQIDIRLANAIGFLSGILLKATDAADMEARLEEVERIVSNERSVASVFEVDPTEMAAEALLS
jgi:hypothetical protein